MSLNLAAFNALSQTDAIDALLKCCTTDIWAKKLAALRPFTNIDELKQSADSCWKGLTESDYLQAFDGHPKIGDVNSLKAKYANTHSLAKNEQSRVAQADDEVINALADDNQRYFERFGFIFIVFASGKSAGQMLDLLRQRIDNDRATELENAAEQQRLIFQLRLDGLIDQESTL